MDREDRSFLKTWLGVGLLLHLLAAIFSLGFQNSDEHFQILEFLAYWLGKSPAADLPIEFHRQMRPWLQPFFHALPVWGLQGAGIENPFAWATAIRVQSALVGWLSTWALAVAAWKWVPDRPWRRVAIMALSLMWFIPALHARHSSENLSGAVFAIALAVLAGESRWRFLLAGLLAGTAFEFRYQTGVMSLGLFLWMALVLRARLPDVLKFLTGALVSLAFGTALDRIGYGVWTFAPWNYFVFNFSEGGLDAAGVYPAWDFFRRVWTESWPVLGFLNLLAFLVSWARHPRHLLTWSVAPLLVFHSFVGHKEMRFLFPMAHFAPLALALAFSAGKGQGIAYQNLLSRRWLRWLGMGVLALNLVALISLTFVPALFSIRFYSAVYDAAAEAPAGPFTLRYPEEDPYVLNGIPMYFYRPAGLSTQKIEARESRADGNRFWLASPTGFQPAGLTPGACRSVASTYPSWFPQFRWKNWTLFRCEPLR